MDLLEAIDSLAPYLLDTARQGIRDLQLIRQNIDLNDEELESSILKFLTPSAPEYGAAEYRGLVLVGFDLDNYPSNPNEKEASQLLSEISVQVQDWKRHLQSRVTTASIETFELHVLFVPFPSVDDFRIRFLQEIGARNDAR